MPDWLMVFLLIGGLLFGSWLFLLLIMFAFMAGASTRSSKYEDMFDITIKDREDNHN